MKEPFVSVLTPVYNGGKFIKKCIESVLDQNYDNWEYVIVDNCSTDQTPSILEEYPKKDQRIRIVHNKVHVGHLENGNIAFREMSESSKYCKVLHADDWLFPECLKEMVQVAEKFPSVGIVGSYRMDGINVNLDGLPYPSHCVPGKKIARSYLSRGRYYLGSPSSLLLRSCLIRKLDQPYDPSNIHSDVALCLELLKESDFGFVHQVLTYTRRHKFSITERISKKYDSYNVGRLMNLLAYGEYYFNKEELSREWETQIKIHYQKMANNYLESRSLERLKYDIADMEKFGANFELRKLLRSLWMEGYRKVISQLKF